MSYIDDSFGLLSWNVYKKNANPDTIEYLKTLHKDKSLDLILLQEAKFSPQTNKVIEYFPSVEAANLSFGDNLYGVVSGCVAPCVASQTYISNQKELMLLTRKAMVYTQYEFQNQQKLNVFNLHAINFTTNSKYKDEIVRLEGILDEIDGPAVVAGDFNAWNKTRTKLLHDLAVESDLNIVPYSKQAGIKSFLGHPLDFVLFRGLKLDEYQVLDDAEISDHRPLFARFSRL